MKPLSRLLLFFLLALAAPVIFAVTEYSETLSRAQWPEEVNGTNISAIPQVSQILRLFVEDENITLEIHYPNNDLGKQWAESLGYWLVTFGIPIHYVKLFADSGAADQIVISLVDRR
ncbi:hypothetical protein [Candidatus Spongiihabitans sp.]|uniref:hypothetical protein n=1 Tax=Candidatus Spongiihabitans sp. TaxID=3101308 RepID=UPI003C6F7F88